MDPLSNGPFKLEPFSFQGVRRGFKLVSPYAGASAPQAIIFVEKAGAPFQVSGIHIGEAAPKE